MSGGVDSSTAAAVLKGQGHEVIGIGLRLPQWGNGNASGRSCCGIEGMDDARRIASQIGIPFYVLNYEEIFGNSVVDYFCRSYLKGETPNPCVECNRVVKFGYLWDTARSLGADCIATGHYARIAPDPVSGRYTLKKGTDREKDQSYFLYPLTQDQLSRTIFPLGGMTKLETRKLARSLGLRVSGKPASQDICFLGNGDYRRFLAERLPEALAPGPILDTQGRVLGEHNGIAFYTIGQRKGIGLAVGRPVYVLRIAPGEKAITVGTRKESLKRRVLLRNVNWVSRERPSGPIEVHVKIRYRQPELPASVVPLNDDHAEVVFAMPQGGLAPGQSAVFYDADTVLGGGIIACST